MACSKETYWIKTPETQYQQRLAEALFQNYAPKALFRKPPEQFKCTASPFQGEQWRLPERYTTALDTLGLNRDFYTNNVDWGPLLGVNLGDTSYAWNRTTKEVQECSHHDTSLSSIKWNPESSILACGDALSTIKLTDIVAKKMLMRIVRVSEKKIISMDWRSAHELTVASNEGFIHHCDIRARTIVPIETSSRSNMCSVTWNQNNLLAAGSNDNMVRVFDIRRLDKLLHTHSHLAAVKALAWLPGEDRSLLLSGGGTYDRSFKIVSVNTHEELSAANADAQICSVAFLAKGYFVAGLGFDAPESLQLWRFSSDNYQLKAISGSNAQPGRIINVCKDPSDSSIAALSGEETLCIWDIKSLAEKPKSGLTAQKSFLEAKTIR